MVFGPQPGDAHQDHRPLAELLPTEFRDHLILGYEILKWETDTPRADGVSPARTRVAEEKVTPAAQALPVAGGPDWFDGLAFLGLSRLRGVQCRNTHAEGFVLEKATLTFQPVDPGAPRHFTRKAGTRVTTVFTNPDITDDERRARIYSGQVLVHSASPESLALIEHARNLITELFGETRSADRAIRHGCRGLRQTPG